MVFNFGPTMQTLGFLSLFLFCFFNFWVGERERGGGGGVRGGVCWNWKNGEGKEGW